MKHDYICGTWSSHELTPSSTLIIPDGCRDLIFSQTKGMKPRWFVSPLFDQAEIVDHAAKTTLYGYRFKPGTRIDEDGLSEALENKCLSLIDNYLGDFLYVNVNVTEALKCLSAPMQSINQAAVDLGVSHRTLQRLLMKETTRSPSYWMLLARARHTAKAIIKSGSIMDAVYDYGYFDQSHLCREMRRWFTCKPLELIAMKDVHQQFYNSGYW